MENLIKRLERVEAIAEIQKLQGKYYRCLDSKLWDELGEVFAPEFNTAFSDGRLVFTYYEGEGGLRQYYEKEMGNDTMISQHNGHTPEITINEDGTQITLTLPESTKDLGALAVTIPTLSGDFAFSKGDGYIQIGSTQYNKAS